MLLGGYPLAKVMEPIKGGDDSRVLSKLAGDRMPKALLISVVDDDQFFRASIGRLVTSLGYAVEDFVSAAAFLASTRLAETACLIADVHMPKMSGVELYKHLIDMGLSFPTILVTGRPDDVERKHALDDGVVCYLSKPIKEERLIRCLRLALQSG